MSKRAAKAVTKAEAAPAVAEMTVDGALGMQGVPGFAAYRGNVETNETSRDLQGTAKYKTFSELATNIAIVATGLRAHLNLVGSAAWRFEAASGDGIDPTEAEVYADRMKTIIKDMGTPWRTVVRRLASYRFTGAAIEEKRAVMREDGAVGIASCQRRSMSTIERWELDMENGGEVLGVYQRSPQDGKERLIDRWKLVYLVDDTVSDSPEGVGMLRHLVESARILKVLEKLEGYGYQNDIAGMPIIRAPIGLLGQKKDPVSGKPLTASQVTAILQPYVDFLDGHAISPQRGLLLDSATYTANDATQAPSGVYQYSMELASAASGQQASLAAAIERKTREMARVMGIEHLLMGSDGKGSLALGADKSDNFAVVINGTLDDIADAADRDVVHWVWLLNGWPMALKPKMRPEPVSYRDVTQITAALAQLATAGLAPGDPATDEVRALLELSPQPTDLVEADAMLSDPGQDPGAAAAATADGAPPEVAPVSLNGAQVTSMLELITQVAQGQLPRESAIELIVAAFPIDRATAARILGKIGAGFTPEPPAAAAPPAAPAAAAEKAASEETKTEARAAVWAAIEAGDLPHPNDVACVDCGHEHTGGNSTKHNYDHHRGYSGANALDVEAVCTTCHAARSKE